MYYNYELEIAMKKSPKKYIKNEILGVISLEGTITINQLHSRFFPCNVVDLIEFMNNYVKPLIKNKKIIATGYDLNCNDINLLGKIELELNNKVLFKPLIDNKELNRIMMNERDNNE